MRITLRIALATALSHCGAAASAPPAGDAGADLAPLDATSDRPTSGGVARVRVRVTYAGRPATGATLQLVATSSPTLRGDPDSFALVEGTTFPASGELVFGTAGSFYVFAFLNAPPVEATPGPEDRVARTPMPLPVALGTTQDVAIEILDRDG